jgi:hypothetical protein
MAKATPRSAHLTNKAASMGKGYSAVRPKSRAGAPGPVWTRE